MSGKEGDGQYCAVIFHSFNSNLDVSLGVERPGDDHVRHELLHLLPGGAGADHLQDHGPPGLRPGPKTHSSQVNITNNGGYVIQTSSVQILPKETCEGV